MLKIEEIKKGEFVKCEGIKQELQIVDVEFGLHGRFVIVLTDGKEEYRRSPKMLVLV